MSSSFGATQSSTAGAIKVRAGAPLAGEVAIGGAKNSVLKLMAACLLAEGEHTLARVPDIADVEIMAELLSAMGVSVRRDGDRLTLTVPADVTTQAPYELVERMRASIVVLGPLLARHGFARVAMPGGDDFGPRPIDMHMDGLSALGATFKVRGGDVEARADELVGAELILDYPSVGATENVMMAAVLARGRTVVDNAAREPEICDLARFLNEMGARVAGAGSDRVTIIGVKRLQPAERPFVTMPDRVEAATFLAAVGMAGGEVVLRGARADHMAMLVRKLRDMGMEIDAREDGVAAHAAARLRAADMSTLPYPGLATDYKPALMALLSTAAGTGIVTENIFTGRFRYVDELRRMGADIRTEAHHAVVRGVDRLSGAPVRAHDIRAGAALVVAGLGATGTTTVADAHHVDRGYESFVGKLASLGANVERT